MKPIKRLKSSLNSKDQNLSSDAETVYAIDSPTKSSIASRKLLIEGWIIPGPGMNVKGVRAKNGTIYHDIPFGKKRPDVALAYPNRDPVKTLYSGFSKRLDFNDGSLVVEVDLGEGFLPIFHLDISYTSEALKDTYYNPYLSENFAEHLNLLDNRRKYFYESDIPAAFKRNDSTPRLVAFYLPQFHPIEENDRAWGKGFTDWRNVASAVPRFVGHQQPVLPQDLGFYDLRLDSVIKDQIDLAKRHGLYGFCFYYYWFSGKKLLDHPMESFLKHTEWDFNFMICWANENWTKRWDGRDSEVIITQEYRAEDPLAFAKDIEHIITDPRYIQEAGKPILAVYRPKDLGDPKRYTKAWRQYFKENHGMELQLVSVMGFDDSDPREYGFDEGLDFSPQTSFFKKSYFKDQKYPMLDMHNKLLDIKFQGEVADYRQVALNGRLNDYFNFPTYKSVTTSWDNDSRRKGSGFVMQNYSPDLYAGWLNTVLRHETRHKEAPIVFINAWNEWAENAVLEPSLHNEFAFLNKTSEVLAKYGPDSAKKAFPSYGLVKSPSTKLAIVVHVYYPEEWRLIKEKLVNLRSVGHDIFVTVSEKDPRLGNEIKKIHGVAGVFMVPNRGRDVLPFMILVRRLSEAGYEYVLKLHTKKSIHRPDGHDWFGELLNNLVPSAEAVKDAVAKLEEGVALIGPKDHFVSLERYMGANAPAIERLLSDIDVETLDRDLADGIGKYGYFASTMFWARLKNLQPLLDLYLMPDDFEAEEGQIDGTMAHALERMFSLLPLMRQEMVYQISAKGIEPVSPKDVKKNYKYAP
jgi:lipopolysaccharide biosynthesis protein